jgi:hypothetical protein
MSKKKKRLVVTNEHTFKYPCERVFQLACPVKEDDWLPGWRELKELVYADSGIAEGGCVFKTKDMPHLMGPATWVCNVYEPYIKIQYSAVNERLVYQIKWDCAPTDNDCRVLVRRTWTALTAEAEEFLAKLGEFTDQGPPDLFALMEYYLKTGKMMAS